MTWPAPWTRPCPRCGAHTKYTCCSNAADIPPYSPERDDELHTEFEALINTDNKENNNMDIRSNLIHVLKESYDMDAADINVVLDACGLEEIATTINITATYTVTVTFEDVPLGSYGFDVDDLGTYELERLLDDDGRYCDVNLCDDVEFVEAEVA